MRMHRNIYVLAIGILTLSACQSARETVQDGPAGWGYISPGHVPPAVERPRTTVDSPTIVNPAALERIDALIMDFIDAQAFPGAVVSVGQGTHVAKMTEYGTYTYAGQRRMKLESLFDLASLTKVVATTTAAMILFEERRLDIEAPVFHYLEAFNTAERRPITVRHLLTHTSGLPAWRPFYLDGIVSREAVLDSILTAALLSEPGEEYVYSDFGMISLALAIESITKEPFDQWCSRHIFEPLGMKSTGFRITGIPDPTVVPTELDDYFRNRLIQGEVHDETAWTLGGVAGHAGLFSTALDLSRFAQMMAQRGNFAGKKFLQPQTIDLFTAVVDTSFGTRALGWDTRNLDNSPSSAGQRFGSRSYGHTGFTGTSLWIDPDSEVWVILLTNRVYPTRDEFERFRGIRGSVADAVYEAFFWPLP